jgi:hypothetical protein
VIGGRVFDVTAIVDFATARSVYAEALVMTAIEENIVLVVPSAALARAAALIPAGHELGPTLGSVSPAPNWAVVPGQRCTGD